MGKPWMLIRAVAVLVVLVTRQASAFTHIPLIMNTEPTISYPTFADAGTETTDVNVAGTTILPDENEERIFNFLEAEAFEFEERRKLDGLPSKACSSMTASACQTTSPDNFKERKSDKDILDTLLKATQYDKRLLPPVKGPLTVNVSVLLLSLATPDESSVKYEVEFLLQQQWYDPRLRYLNHSEFEFLNAIHHHENIWLPDTYFIMHGDFKNSLNPEHFSLRIYRNGSVNYLMRRHLILSCQGRLNIFPFDNPKCTFSLESTSYEVTSMKYVWVNNEDDIRKSPGLSTLNAHLMSNHVSLCPQHSNWRGDYSCLTVLLIFTRDRAFYFSTVFIPGITLVMASFITFWLEWNAVPARTTLGVTTMLNFFTNSNDFRLTLPVVTNLTAMYVWEGVCMCFIFAAFLEFVCVNYVGRKSPSHNIAYRSGESPFIQRLPALINRIGFVVASPSGNKKMEAANEIVTCANCGPNPCTQASNRCPVTEVLRKEPPHPIRVAKTIDVVARVVFPAAFAAFVIFFFYHYRSFNYVHE